MRHNLLLRQLWCPSWAHTLTLSPPALPAAAAPREADKPQRRVTVASEREREALVMDAQNRIERAKKAMLAAQEAQQARGGGACWRGGRGCGRVHSCAGVEGAAQ